MSSEGMSKMSMEDDEKPASEKNSIAQRRKLFKNETVFVSECELYKNIALLVFRWV